MMDSALCLSYGPHPTIPLDLPSSMSFKQANQLLFSRSSLSFSSGSTRRRRPYTYMFNPIRAQNGPPGQLNFGLLALKSLLDVSINLASSKAKGPSPEPTYEVSRGPSAAEVDAIKMKAVGLMKSGKPDGALNLLRDEYSKNKKYFEPANNLELALVEILIHQEKFEEALKCDCLNDEKDQYDRRVPLYKAIIYSRLANAAEANENAATEANKYWDNFLDLIEKKPHFGNI